MSLLKGDGTAPQKTDRIVVIAWPTERLPEGIGLSVKDGWNFGVGLGLALTFALPVILVSAGLVISIILLVLSSLGI